MQNECLLDFGRNKGRDIGQVDDRYLQWMLKSFPDASHWRKTAADAIGERTRGLGAWNLKENERTCNANAVLLDLKCCSMRRDLKWGRKIHAEAVKSGSGSNMSVVIALIRMYAKCHSMLDARRVFDSVHMPSVRVWTCLLLGYAENGEGHVSLVLYSKMKADGCVPDAVAYLAALKACTSTVAGEDGSDKAQALESGRMIHSEIGCALNLQLQNTLIDMYAKCGSMVEARQVFDLIQKPDVVSWTVLLLGYAENGEGYVALELFFKMNAQGCAPDSRTYVAILKACTSVAVNGDSAHGLETGCRIHLQIGEKLDVYVQNTLIDMYAKCGSMVDANCVFERIQMPDVISWTTLILGYAENGEGHVSLNLFSRMKDNAFAPNSVTYLALFKACGSIGALSFGRKHHSDILDFTVRLVTCLVDFYGKCGSMVEAREVFDRHPSTRDYTTWNALLAGYSSSGDRGSVFSAFQEMLDDGLRPSAVTFLCLLLCCSHDVAKARQYLEEMPLYGVTPDVFHYNCMVDVLGRAGRLSEAAETLRSIPCSPNAVTWSALLGACVKWRNVGVGRMAFQSLIEMDKQSLSAYVLMGHIYGSLGMWEEQQKVLDSRIKLVR